MLEGEFPSYFADKPIPVKEVEDKKESDPEQPASDQKDAPKAAEKSSEIDLSRIERQSFGQWSSYALLRTTKILFLFCRTICMEKERIRRRLYSCGRCLRRNRSTLFDQVGEESSVSNH